MNKHPNLWLAAALAWSVSFLFINFFVMPLWFDPVAGRSILFALQAASPGGTIALWIIGARHKTPGRLLHAAMLTCLFMYIVPLATLLTPLAVVIMLGTRGEEWQGSSAAITAACALVAWRIHQVATDKRFDNYLERQARGGEIRAQSLPLLFKGSKEVTAGPAWMDIWSIAAATAIGITAQQASQATSTGCKVLLAIACITTPLAMHVLSRLAVVAYLWIYRLEKYERKSGSPVKLALPKH